MIVKNCVRWLTPGIGEYVNVYYSWKNKWDTNEYLFELMDKGKDNLLLGLHNCLNDIQPSD